MNCLKEYTYQDFVIFIEEKLELSYWDIWDSDITNRISRAKLHERFEIIQNLANDANIYPSDLEVLSWLDTLNILYRILAEIPDNIKNELKIIQEYMIPFSKKRSDYILLYRNKILILEFSFSNDEEQDYKSKLKQVLGYKELMLDLLPNNIDIGTYVFLIQPEIEPTKTYHNKQNKYTQQQDKVNSENIFSIQQYIMLFFTKEQEVAYNELNKLHQQEIKTIENLILNSINESSNDNARSEHETIVPTTLKEKTIMERYEEMCKAYPDYIIAIQNGKLYEIYGKNAKMLAREYDFTLFQKNNNQGIYCFDNQQIVSLITKTHNIAFGSCLEDMKFYKKTN